jgi:hypothetical protein
MSVVIGGSDSRNFAPRCRKKKYRYHHTLKILTPQSGKGKKRLLTTSVGDPDPDVFGNPGSGSISQRYGSGSGSGSFYFLIKVLSGQK